MDQETSLRFVAGGEFEIGGPQVQSMNGRRMGDMEYCNSFANVIAALVALSGPTSPRSCGRRRLFVDHKDCFPVCELYLSVARIFGSQLSLAAEQSWHGLLARE